MKSRWLLSLIALGFLCLYLGWQGRSAQTALVQSQISRDSEVTALLAEQTRLEGEIRKLQIDLDKAKTWPFVACSDLGVAQMRTQGLNDPIADLIANLATQTDLVPFQPIGGGQARIGVWLINCGWVLAVVEDGHKGLLAILDYEVDNGQIKWSVRAAESDPAFISGSLPQVPQQASTAPNCDFALPDEAPQGAQPIEPNEFTPAVIAGAITSANRPDWGQLHITVTNAWQVTDELKAAAGYSEAGAGALVLLTAGGESHLFMLGVRGAPGPASIHSIKGDFVIVSQGYGFLAVNYRTGEVFRCGRTRDTASEQTVISRDEAIKTALAGIVGDLTVPRAVLNEQWRSPDNPEEALPVWEVTIAYKTATEPFAIVYVHAIENRKVITRNLERHVGQL